MTRSLYMSLFHFCLSACTEHTSEYFPTISNSDQAKIYAKYISLIENQENSEHLTELWDSTIDIQKAKDFRNKTEEGDSQSVVVIDLGGSSLKLSFIKWRCGNKKDKKGEFNIVKNRRLNFSIENETDTLNSYPWYDWVAKKVGIFLKDLKREFPDIKISKSASLSFSFKIKQTGLSSAEFVDFHKHWWFSPAGLNSKDIVEDINKSLIRQNINLEINCVVNDVIATFMSGIAFNMENFMSIIVGTGTNAGYMIKRNDKPMLVNSEWACFNIDGLFAVDECSRQAVAQMETGKEHLLLEVLTAGMKMDEIIRERIRLLKTFSNEDINSLDAKHIYTIYEKLSKIDLSRRNVVTPFELTVFRVFKDFKTRAYRILAPMILAAMKDLNTFSIITNGTIIGMPYDTHILTYELKNAVQQIIPAQKHLNMIYFEENASLIGAAFTSIVFSDEKRNEADINSN